MEMRQTSTIDTWPRFRHSRTPEGPVPASAAARKVAEIAGLAGIRLNGSQPWDMRVLDDRFFQRALEGSVGLGESYMDGWWDAESLDEFFTRVRRAELYKQVAALSTVALVLKARLLNLQAQSRARQVAQEHYDIGTDLYEAMLDRSMQYTCAYWPEATTLDEAQANKLRLIARKLHLSPGMKVLDLGGGFGGLAHFLAVDCRCEVVSYNISREQVAYARRMCEGLPIRFQEKDYREAANEPQQFDRVVSIGLCEHVGYKNYRAFLQLAHDRLKKGGLFLLHTIGANQSFTYTDPWIDKYIFPNGDLPSMGEITSALEGLFVVEDVQNFGSDYDRTLMAWNANFQSRRVELAARHGERFCRMWEYYLLQNAGAFRCRHISVGQLVLTPHGLRGGYQAVR